MEIFTKHLLIIFSLTNFFCTFIAKDVKSSFEFKVSVVQNLIKNENWNCTDIVNLFMQRSAKYNKRLNAIINLNSKALEQAIVLDDYYHTKRDFIGRLHCVPIAIKDNIDVLGLPTTGGIKPLRHSFPQKDALVVKRLLDQGAIIISKTNLGELASGNDESEMGGKCKNPFDEKRSCGPSSIGSGAVIASGLAVIALGTDTDGSITCPASFNGIFGLRPPQNVPSVEGIIPSFARQDTVGPFAKYIDDLVLTHSIITANLSIYDEYSSSKSTNLKVGIISNFVNNFTISDETGTMRLNYWIDAQVKKEIDHTVEKFKSLKIGTFEYTLNQTQLTEFLLSFQSVVISSAKCMSACKKQSLNSYFGEKDRFGSDSPIKNFEQLFNSPLLSQYWIDDFKPSNVNNPEEFCSSTCVAYDSLSKQFTGIVSKWFETDNIDSILIPTRGLLPYVVGEPLPDTLPSFLSISAITGYSALNFPVGYSNRDFNSPDGLPIGLLLISKPDRLFNSFKIAKAFEQSYGIVKLPSSTPILTSQVINEAIKAITLNKTTFLFIFLSAIMSRIYYD